MARARGLPDIKHQGIRIGMAASREPQSGHHVVPRSVTQFVLSYVVLQLIHSGETKIILL